MSSERSNSDEDRSLSDSSPANSDERDSQTHADNSKTRNQVNYLNTFQTPDERIQGHELPKKSTIPPVHYVKSLDSSIVYFSVLAGAALIYWCDVRYNLIENSISMTIDKSQDAMHLTEYAILHCEQKIKQMTPLKLFITALSFALVVILMSKCLMRVANKKNAEMKEEEELLSQKPEDVRALDEDEAYSFEKGKKPHSNFITKITPAVYEYQATVGTRAELAKLTQSPQYKRMLQEKGEDVAEYNWKTKETLAGHIETEDYELKFCALDLNRSLEKMDKELLQEREKDETLSKPRYSSDPSQQSIEAM